jgi:hypothetical protein
MARTKVYFERLVGRLATMLKFPEYYWQMQLHCYTPGNRNLYQIQIVDKRDGGVLISLPDNRSLPSEGFDLYLNGILDSARNLEGMWRDD